MLRKENPHPLDQEFAAAADELLAGRLENIESEDAELSALINTLKRVDAAFTEDEYLKTEAKERIRKNLHSPWLVTQEQKATERPDLLSRLRDFFWQKRQPAQLAFSLVMILLVLVLTPFFFNTNPDMAATAGTQNFSKISLLIVVGVIFVSGLAWILKRKR